jgi:hypothetical protein
MDLQTTISDKHVIEDLELQLAESVSKIKFQKRKLVDIEETRDYKIANMQGDSEGQAECMQKPEMDKGLVSHAHEPMTTHDLAPTSSQQHDDSPHKIGRILSFNCTGSDSKDKNALRASLQSAAAGIKEKSIGEFSFEEPSFSLGISDISSQETNSQSQVDLTKKPRRMIFRRTLQLPPCPPSLGSKASAQVQEHCVTVKQVTEAQDDSRVIIVDSESQEHGVQGNPIQVDSQSQDQGFVEGASWELKS